ncbi:MAG: trypsin-like peptidase domain-containing protein [Anaerolineae bacterium]|nr:trypsin-like peptidase domain-containing protein [Anaerolineae bacterium]
MSTLVEQLNDAAADRIARVHASLVQISNGRGAGAGTIWHSDGLIVTNAHVIRGCHHLSATLPDGRKLAAQVIAADDSLDLAALSVEATDLPTIAIGDSRGLKPGQWVMAVGHPWGVTGAVTAGVVIGTGDNLPEVNQMQPGREWIALNLHMRPGHSGGPLIDSAGRLVGINTMITGPDVGFAIPVHIVKAFLKDRLGTPVTASVL